MADVAYYPPGYSIPASRIPSQRTVKKFNFLALPGEIRNRIYDLVVENHHFLIHGNHPQKLLSLDKEQRAHRVEESTKPRYRLSCTHLSSSDGDGWNVYSWRPMSLLYVSKQVSQEVVPFLYAKATLRFESMITLSKFLSVVSPLGLASVRKLELVHATYGEPELLDMREWKIRHDAKWMKLCKQIAVEMTSLEYLKVDLRICDWPTQLEPHAKWAKPLLSMKGQGLDRVDVVLRNNLFTPQRLDSAARKLAMEMMNEDGRRKMRSEQRGKVEEMKTALAMPFTPKPIQTLKILPPSVPLLAKPGGGGLVRKTINKKYLTEYASLKD